MQTNDILRLAFVLSDSASQKFLTNLRKIVKLILFESYENPVKISFVVSKIKEQYSLEFDSSEVLASIKKDKGIIITSDQDPVDTLYSLTPEEYQKMALKQVVGIDTFIHRFIKENSNQELVFEEVKETIYEFLYYTFNSDTKTVLRLMNRESKDIEEYRAEHHFTLEKSEIINEFLNWDNYDKNEFILKTLSACFDYCMLTVKKDSDSYFRVFNGKTFFLDSNIIFRLAGFNKIERKNVMDAFINKCKAAKINICYTNQTNAEIHNTIKHYVESLRITLKKQSPVSLNAYQALSSKYANLDFYEKYFQWCKNPINTAGDFKAFQSYLEREIRKVTSNFKLVVIDSYETSRGNENFNKLVEEFTAYKTEKYKNTHEEVIKTDINNYLYILEKNNNGQATNFMEIKHFFITADHCLTEWATIKRPGTVPVFVLPSVWYSILLKYLGRTDDDYKSFCQFLNISIAPEHDDLADKKAAMLTYILDLNESKEIKELIIFDVEKRLNNSDEDIENPIVFVDESHKTILQEKLEENRRAIEITHEQKVIDIKESLEKQSTLEIEQLSESYEKKIKDTNKDSFAKGVQSIVSKQIHNIQRRNHKIVVTLSALWVVALICFFVSFVSLIITNSTFVAWIPEWFETNTAFITILSAVFSLIGAAFKFFLGKITLLSEDEKIVRAKLEKKYDIK